VYTSRFKLGLGDKVRDSISGHTGVITCRSDSLHGCAQYCVRPQEIKDGKPVEGSWFDEGQLELVESGVVKSYNAPSPTPIGGIALDPHPRH